MVIFLNTYLFGKLVEMHHKKLVWYTEIALYSYSTIYDTVVVFTTMLY